MARDSDLSINQNQPPVSRLRIPRWTGTGGILFVLMMVLASCMNASSATSTAQPIPISSPSPSGNLATPVETIQPTAEQTQSLTIWVPPQFSPQSGNEAGKLLQMRLDRFMFENPNVRVEVRVKAVNGPGSLLETLATANAAAPGALPSLVALNRNDLESAAIKGLIYPMDGQTTIMDEPDWYAYASQLSVLQGSTFGLPFAGDALLMVYRPSVFGEAVPSDWAAIKKQSIPVAFPVMDQQAFVTLALYQSLGGEVEDEQGHPSLEADVLVNIFNLYDVGIQQGVFPAWLSDMETYNQSWQAFREQRVPMAITWSSLYLSEQPDDTAAMVLPSLGENSVTEATGWIWCLSDPNPERRAISIKLAEYLVDSEFLTAWDAAAGMLPTRPTALNGWPEQSLRAVISQTALSARPRPRNELLASIGPILEDATLQVIRRQKNPEQAALEAASRLATPAP